MDLYPNSENGVVEDEGEWYGKGEGGAVLSSGQPSDNRRITGLDGVDVQVSDISVPGIPERVRPGCPSSD